MRIHLRDTNARKALTSELNEVTSDTEEAKTPLRLLLVEDDPIFRRLLTRIARRKGISLTECGSLHELENMANPGGYDAAVVDYFLDGIAQDFRGTTLAGILGETPVVLISGKEDCFFNEGPWPRTIRKFVNKAKGAEEILEAAIRVGEK